ncbi:hypothetical protein [uncultured Rubinisphaera sp.]|uniref:hypothetical protein n=1 Tax=uncultured Rubinisphaera sp. TaxID=1678686 RepID=UPI0030D86F49
MVRNFHPLFALRRKSENQILGARIPGQIHTTAGERQKPQYYNTKRSHMERDHLLPIRAEPDEVASFLSIRLRSENTSED